MVAIAQEEEGGEAATENPGSNSQMPAIPFSTEIPSQFQPIFSMFPGGSGGSGGSKPTESPSKILN